MFKLFIDIKVKLGDNYKLFFYIILTLNVKENVEIVTTMNYRPTYYKHLNSIFKKPIVCEFINRYFSLQKQRKTFQ